MTLAGFCLPDNAVRVHLTPAFPPMNRSSLNAHAILPCPAQVRSTTFSTLVGLGHVIFLCLALHVALVGELLRTPDHTE
jgi:hypothetical protein